MSHSIHSSKKVRLFNKLFKLLSFVCTPGGETFRISGKIHDVERLFIFFVLPIETYQLSLLLKATPMRIGVPPGPQT